MKTFTHLLGYINCVLPMSLLADIILQAYPLDDFDNSSSLQIQTITGDASVRCAVRIQVSNLEKI